MELEPKPSDELNEMQPGLERVHRIGPFVCEWCGMPLTKLNGTRREGQVIRATGICRDHGDVWAKDVTIVEGE